MGLIDSIKNIMTIPDEDEFEEDFEEVEEQPKKRADDSYSQRKQESPRVVKSKTVSYNPNAGQMQVVLVKPDRFEDVAAIADHLNDRKTVVLNLESADKDVSRRIVDFLSGAAYANHGYMKKIANCTFIIAARGVDVSGELMLDDFDESKLYF